MSEIKEVNTETLNQLMEFLQGNSTPNEFKIEPMPNLDKEQAWNVIYILQEFLGVIPDHFEKCDCCGTIFNRDEPGEKGLYTGDDAITVQENIDAGYNIKKGDIGKFYCEGCL